MQDTETSLEDLNSTFSLPDPVEKTDQNISYSFEDSENLVSVESGNIENVLEDNNIESIQLDYAVSECRSRICLKSFFLL